MDPVLLVIIAVTALAALGLLAATVGVDTRDGFAR
jgi:hypothetical protein